MWPSELTAAKVFVVTPLHPSPRVPSAPTCQPYVTFAQRAPRQSVSLGLREISRPHFLVPDKSCPLKGSCGACGLSLMAAFMCACVHTFRYPSGTYMYMYLYLCFIAREASRPDNGTCGEAFDGAHSHWVVLDRRSICCCSFY